MKAKALGVLLLLLTGCSQDDSSVTGTQGHGPGGQAASARQQKQGANDFAKARAARARQSGTFAGLPDRGGFAAYAAPDRVIREGAYIWHRAEISEAHALHALAGRPLRITTPSGDTLEIAYDHHIEHDSGDWTWVGHLPGDPGAQTILTFGADAVFGSIAQHDKPPLRLTSRDGSAWLVETDPAKLVGIASAGANPRETDQLRIPGHLLDAQADVSGKTPATGMVESPQASATAAAATVVDVLVGYTGGISSRSGGASAALTRINFLVAVTNQAYANSQVNAKVRLVHAMPVNYTETNSNTTALNELTGNGSTPNAAFNALRAARDQYGADLVVLLRQFRDPEQGGCGVAWLIGGGKTPSTMARSAAYGYSVVSDGQDRNEQDGNTYYCFDESFAHELGHNMGLAHDRTTAMDGDGRLDDPGDYGAYPYSFGYRTGATGGSFHTVMAYADQGQQQYRVFSNPRVSSCGGRACGTVNDDNARALTQTIPIIAAFRAQKVPQPQSARNDFNGDGRSDILWRDFNRLDNAIWYSANSATSQTPARVAGTAWVVAGTGDFNGDGRSDILWRNNSNGNNDIWYSGNAATQPFVSSAGAQWRVVGIGDFNGDGRSDILWRDFNKLDNAIWFSANSATSQTLARVASTAWVVAGTGDFNGDGRSDILWRNNSNGNNDIWYSGNAASQPFVSSAGAQWRVVGIGDFNGDGRSDILWRDFNKLDNAIWLSANSATSQTLARVASTAWVVAGTGDFNGDGRSDILWRNNSNGNNDIWYSGNAASQPFVSSAGIQWRVVGQ